MVPNFADWPQGAHVAVIIINGLDTPIGRAIASRVSQRAGVRVVSDPAGVTPGELVTVVLLSPGHGPDVDGTALGGVDAEQGSAWLRSLAGLDVDHLIVLSSATVYGAWSDNPVPLTEDAPVRPNPEAGFARGHLQLERAALGWASTHNEPPVSILRPTLVISPERDGISWLERSLWHTPTAKFGDADPHGQFLTRSDLVEAIAHLIGHSAGGVYNVAPDGWLTVERQIELAGRGGRIRVSERLARRVAIFRWVFQLTSTPPEVLPYTMHSWVIANDRLTSTGWRPSSTNEEAFVSASRPGWWASMHGRRRQEVALGLLIGALGAAIGVVVMMVRRSRRSAR